MTAVLYSQHLNLPTEDIIGHLTPVADSLVITKDYSNYYNFSNIERLAYKPVLEKEIDPNAFSAQKGYLYIHGGTPMHLDARLGLYSQKIPELNVYFRFFTENHDDFKASKIENDWLPLTGYTPWKLQPGVYLKRNMYKYEIIHEEFVLYHEPIMTSGGFSISIKPNSQSYFKLYGNYLSYKYNSSGLEYDFSQPEILLQSNIYDLPYINETELKIYSFYEKFQMASDVYFNFTYLDLLALHFQYSDDFWPSIRFEQAFEISEIAEFSIANRPYIEAKSLSEYFDRNPFAFYLNKIEFAEQAPWNAYMIFTLLNPIEIQVTLNSRYIQNKHYINYTYNDVVKWFDMINAVERFTYYKSNDAFINSISTEALKRINNFSFGANAKFMFSELTTHPDKINLPWEPHLVLGVSAGYKYKKFNTELAATQLMQRYNSGVTESSKPEDVLILSNKNSLDVNKHFKLTLDIELPTDKYSGIEGLPEKGFSALLGIRLLF